jgi:hypothetical protein
MPPVTQTVRDQGFLPLYCDIPEGTTIAQYRAGRSARPRRLGRLRLRLRSARR